MEEKKPLMLKELLELESYAESCDGFGCYPRYLTGNPELRSGSRRCRNGGDLVAKISAAIRVGLFLSSPGRRAGALSRSFSRRLRGGFWKKRGEGEEMERRMGNVGVVTNCKKGSPLSPPRRSWSGESAGRRSFHGEADAAAAGAGRRRCETEVVERKMMCHTDEEQEQQQQLSPVSVMDFLRQNEDEEEDDDDDDEIASPTFQQSLANIERAGQQLLQKIRQFELLAELDISDLDQPSPATEDPRCHVADRDSTDEEDTSGGAGSALLGLLEASSPMGPMHCFRKLLVGFFNEGFLSCHMEGPDGRDHAKLLLEAARMWTDGLDRSSGSVREGEIKEIERIGRWRYFREDEGELLAVDLEGAIFWSLVEELVGELCS